MAGKRMIRDVWTAAVFAEDLTDALIDALSRANADPSAMDDLVLRIDNFTRDTTEEIDASDLPAWQREHEGDVVQAVALNVKIDSPEGEINSTQLEALREQIRDAILGDTEPPGIGPRPEPPPIEPPDLADDEDEGPTVEDLEEEGFGSGIVDVGITFKPIEEEPEPEAEDLDAAEEEIQAALEEQAEADAIAAEQQEEIERLRAELQREREDRQREQALRQQQEIDRLRQDLARERERTRRAQEAAEEAARAAQEAAAAIRRVQEQQQQQGPIARAWSAITGLFRGRR